MIKIFAKKNLGFRNPETNEIITVRALEFKEVPDWCEKDPGYGWAVRDGAIQVIDAVAAPGVSVVEAELAEATKPEVEALEVEPTPAKKTRSATKSK